LPSGAPGGDAAAVNLHGLDGLSPQLLLLIVPLVVLQLGLMAFAIVDLLRDDRAVRGGSKPAWAVVIVFVNLIGPILYFLVGRLDAPVDAGAEPRGVPGWGSPHDPPIAPPAPPVGALGLPGETDAEPARPATSVPAPRVDPDPASGRSAIVVENLTKRYPGGVLALDALSMTVPAGSVFGLLGPNGAGKTTTLRLLAGLTRVTAGRASVGGVDVGPDVLGARRDLGYLEQDPRAYGWMTGREQVRFLGRLHGLDGTQLERAVDDALARVDIATVADRRTSTYSGGMRQRLGIAGALVHRPSVAILDEPVSSLDPEGRRDVLNLIAGLRGEITVLFSTHVLADVERICDRVGILAHGRLVVEGPLAELLDRYALPVYRIEAEPGQGAALDALGATLRGLDWVSSVAVEHGLATVAVSDPDRAGREIMPAIAAAGLGIISVARARPTLEDVFLQLTGDASPGAAA
jgi:ABC-2 type transport system ATP-binding protein